MKQNKKDTTRKNRFFHHTSPKSRKRPFNLFGVTYHFYKEVKTGEFIHEDAGGATALILSLIVLLGVNAAVIGGNWWNIVPILTGAALGIISELFVLRHLKTHSKDPIRPFRIERVIYEDERGRKFLCIPQPPLTPAQRANYLEICQKYIEYKRDHPNVSNETIFQEILYIGSTELYDALQAWRLGEFDDRPWYKKAWDQLNGRIYSDLTRYLPPR